MWRHAQREEVDYAYSSHVWEVFHGGERAEGYGVGHV
jgi:hypothetical protein